MSTWLAVRASDKRIACDEEFSDSDDEGDRRDRQAYRQRKKMRLDGRVSENKDAQKMSLNQMAENKASNEVKDAEKTHDKIK